MFNFPEYQSFQVTTGLPNRVTWRIDPTVLLESVKTIEQINKLANDTIIYKPDGLRDHWQEPTETVRRGFGDCEDFCILKYALLRERGFENMAMIVGSDVEDPRLKGRREVHSLLFVYSHGDVEPVVLDNRTPIVHPASYFHKFFAPFYAVNERDTWVYMK